MDDLTDGQLDALIRHAQNAHLHGADYDAIPLLVGEVRRLRDGIAAFGVAAGSCASSQPARTGGRT